MSDAARKLLDEAMTLPGADRARLAAALIASLEDTAADMDAQEAWAAEIERRAEGVRAGASKGAPWDEVRERLLARIGRG